MREAPVFSERTSVGLDVHARSIVGCGLDSVTGEVFRRRLTPTFAGVSSWLAELPAPVAVTYEAGPTGFGLARELTGAGVRCLVAAPSKLQRPPGDRVKTDARDALHLARLLRMDQIVPVRVPSVEQEAARDLVRAVRSTMSRSCSSGPVNDRAPSAISAPERVLTIRSIGAHGVTFAFVMDSWG